MMQMIILSLLEQIRMEATLLWLRKEDYSSFSSVYRVYFSFSNFTLPDGAQTIDLEILYYGNGLLIRYPHFMLLLWLHL
ncbi:hypothetical protein GIB67_002607 [Kingdonia uniflora]|uniref:Uncharacterized protein n=1 Tax=Kingdonia uniflora TaxID=39325 RepID=A0A7J7P826_9MAGN|nr:hypothetical protein GIB67_002607 [Kingdonia uniflora]